MKVFYSAKSFSGENKSGEMEVKNERELASQLREEGFILTSFKELDQKEKNNIQVKFKDRLLGVPLTEKLIFAKNLSVMVASGLTLTRAVENLSIQLRNKRFIEILKEIKNDLQAGASFADSLAKFPAIFSDLFVNMIRVGESSGNLEEVLGILSIQLEKEHDLKRKIRGAMMYPAVIITVMIGIGILMLTYILPKITGVFEDMKVELPASTKFVIALSDFLRDHSFIVVGGMIFSIIFAKLFLGTRMGKKAVSFISIQMPIVKNIVIKVNCARFARFYSSLLRSGVSVVEALKIISETLTNYYYQEVSKEAMEQVQKGIPLSKIIKKHENIFLIQVWQMIEVGEETGKTEAVMIKLAEFYEAEVDQITKNLSSVIEPFLMIIIGAAVGFFAISMLQPVYGLMGNI